MSHINASDFNTAGVGQLFPGYSAGGQETASGLVALDKIPDAPLPQSAELKPAPVKPAISMAAAQKSLFAGIARHAAPQDRGVQSRASAWLKTGSRVTPLYRRPFLRRYAALDRSGLEARRIIEAAKKKPGLLNKADPKGVLRQTLKIDAPAPRNRPHRLYNALKDMRQLMQPTAPKKIISLKQLPYMLPRMGRKLLLTPGMA